MSNCSQNKTWLNSEFAHPNLSLGDLFRDMGWVAGRAGNRIQTSWFPEGWNATQMCSKVGNLSRSKARPVLSLCSLWYMSLTSTISKSSFFTKGKEKSTNKISTFPFFTPPQKPHKYHKEQPTQNLRDRAALISGVAGNILEKIAWKTWESYTFITRDKKIKRDKSSLWIDKHGASCFVFTAHLNVITSSQINCPTIRPFFLLTSRDWRQ